MPVYFQPALGHHHKMLHLQIQHQLVVTEQRKRLAAVLDNQPQLSLTKRHPLEKSHSKKILKRIIVVLPISCYFLFQLPCEIFLSCNLKRVQWRQTWQLSVLNMFKNIVDFTVLYCGLEFGNVGRRAFGRWVNMNCAELRVLHCKVKYKIFRPLAGWFGKVLKNCLRTALLAHDR